MGVMNLRKFRRGSAVLLVLLAATLGACNLDPKAASRKYVETGNKYFSRGKLKEASIMYRRALQKDLKNPDAYYRLALVDLKQNQFAEAAHSLQRAVQLDPSNSDAAAKLADLYFASYLQNPPNRKNEIDEVRAIANTLLKKDPKSYDGLRLKGFLALTERNLPEAIASMQAALRVKPNQPDVMLALSQTLLANKQPAEAETTAKQLMAAHPDFGGSYDFLYGLYARTNRPADAEQLLKTKCGKNPKNGYYMAELAGFYLATNQKDKMTATLNQLTGSVKTIPDAYTIAGDFYFRTRQPDLALAEYRKGEAAQPDRRAVFRKREAQVLVAQGKFQDASRIVDEIIQRDPKDTEGIAMRAALRLQKGTPADINGAIADLQGVLSKAPDAANIAQIHFSLGRAYLGKFETERRIADKTTQLSDLDQARIQFEQAIQTARDRQGIRFTEADLALAQVYIDRDDPARAAQLMTEVLSSEPGNLQAIMMRSTAEMNLRKYADARTDLQTVLKARPGDRNGVYQLAMTNYLDGKLADADQGFETLIKAGDERGMLGLIDSKNRQGKYAEAIQMIQGELKKGSNVNFFRYMLANTEAQAGQYPSAIENFNALIAANPKAEDLYMRLGETALRAGQTEQGIQTFLKAHQIAPNDPFPVLRLGIIYQGQGRIEEARQQYESVLKIEPNQAVALNNLAFMKADAGTDLDQALTLAQRASQQAPNDANIKDTLAYIYTRKGLTDEGLQILQDIVAKNPANATFRIHLAMALLQKGDKTSAKKELNAAESNKPSPDEQRKIKELIAKAG